VRIDGAFHVRIHVVAVAAPELIEALALEINDQPATLAIESAADGTIMLIARPGFTGPVNDGLKLRFRMPYSVRLTDDPLQRRVGIAVGDVRVVPEPYQR
jgi:hypothetical protein